MRMAILTVLVALSIVGCGGGGSNGAGVTAPTNVTPSVTIAWPSRSQPAGPSLVNGPSSALSVQLVLHRTDATQADLTVVGDRHTPTSSHLESYKASSQITTAGTYNLAATFYANAAQQGAIVGTAGAVVKVSNTGSLTDTSGQPLNSINFTGTIKSASILPSQFVRVGQTSSLSASALDDHGGAVVVTPGSFEFLLVSGGTFLTLTESGSATGLELGSSTVRATIDGLACPTTSVSVIPASPSVLHVQLETNDLVYDSLRNVIYATTDAAAPQFPNSVVPIDPATGSLGPVISVGNSPSWMALSGDGSHLYVGGNNGTILQLSMPSGSVLNTITLPAGTVPSDMQTIPGTADSYVVALQQPNGTVVNGMIFDGITPRSVTAPLGNSAAVNDSGTRVYGYQRFQSGNALYYTADIAPTGLTNAKSFVSDIQGFGNRIHASDGLILADDGTSVTPDTGKALGHLTFTTIDHVTGTVRGSSIVYYAAWDSPSIQAFDLSTGTMILSSSLGNVSGRMETLTACGPKRVVIRSFSGAPNTVIIVSGLP